MAKPGTKELLNKILSADLEWVYVYITDKAIEWALSGFIDEANNLLEQLWKFNIPHSKQLWLQDESFQVIWSVSDKQPASIPFGFKNIQEIERKNYNELAFTGINAGCGNSENVENILKTLKKTLKINNDIGNGYLLAAIYGAVLSARNNVSNDVDYFLKIWGEGLQKNWSNYTFSYLLRDRKCGEYLLKGTLAPVFGVSQELCSSEIKEIISQLSNRMLHGRTLVYEHLSWKQLLTTIAHLAIAQKTFDFSEKILLSKSLCSTSATIDEINDAEKKLKVILPDDYKNFLLSSNGFECFSSTGVTLASVDQVGFFIDFDEELVESWADSMDEFDPTSGDKLRNSIIIGGHEEEQQLLLIPLQNDNWECWHFSSWNPGEAIYDSFRFYMEYELQRLEN